MVRAGSGGDGHCSGSDEFLVVCACVSFPISRKNMFIAYFRYADTYFCASLTTCHVLSYDFTSFLLHQGVETTLDESFFDFRGENDMNARDDSSRNKSKHWRRSLHNQRTGRCWKMRYIFVITYYKLTRGRYWKKRQIRTYKVSQIKCCKPVSKELLQIRFVNIILKYLHIVSNI